MQGRKSGDRMKNCLKAQLFILLNRKQFKFIFSVSLALSLFAFIFNVFSYFGQYFADVRAYRDICIISSSNPFSSILVMVLPILSTAAFCDVYIDDRSSNRLSVIFQQCSSGAYYCSSLIISTLAPVFTVFVPTIINLMLNVAAFPDVSPAELTGLASNQAWLYTADSEYMTLLALKKMFILHPFLYTFTYIIFMTLYSCIGAAATYALSYFIKNRAMVIVPFFVFNTLTNVCSSAFYDRFGISISAFDYILSERAVDGINYGVYSAMLLIMLATALSVTKRNISRVGDTL